MELDRFIVFTQVMENYGAHNDLGKHEPGGGGAYWKFKGGDVYLVTGLTRMQDAVAYVAAICMDNELSWKEFPVNWYRYEDWLYSGEFLEDDQYRNFIVETMKHVNPNEKEVDKF